MNCDDASAQLYVYLDGEARFYRRWKMRRHLRKCLGCEGGATFEQRLRIRIKEGCREEFPPELEQRLRAFIRQQSKGTEA